MASRWALWSEDSVLSIASRGSVLSIGSIGSVASFASVGSVASCLSAGSTASFGSFFSFASARSFMSARAHDAVFGHPLEPRDAAIVAGGLAAVAWLYIAATRRTNR